MNILGINSIYQDSSSTLINNSGNLYCVEEERFTGIKHTKKASPYAVWLLPFYAINWCLGNAGITLQDVDHIKFLPKDFTVNTGHGALRTTFSVVLPIKK